MMVPELQGLANIISDRLLNTAAEGFVLTGMVWVLLRLFRQQTSGTRFVIWFSALLAIVALPFFAGSSLQAAHFSALAPYSNRHIALSSFFAFCLFGMWAVGAGFLFLRLTVGLWQVRNFRKSCSELDLASLDPDVAVVLQHVESNRRVKLCGSDLATVPSAIGFFWPAIVFPAKLLPNLSAEEIQTILLHELAHLHRWDDWTNLAQQIVKALLFFHPAVWWIDHRLTLEREMACDDLVLAQTANPRAYASSLISFAEKLQGIRGLDLAQALLSRMHQLTLRLTQILDPQRPRRSALRPLILGLSAGMFALTLGAAPYMPQIVTVRTQDRPKLMQSGPALEQTLKAAELPSERSMIRPVAERVAYAAPPTPQARAIPASFHARTALTPLRLKQTSEHRPTVRRAMVSQEELQTQQTIVILRSTRYDTSGVGTWTLCIWKVGGNNAEGDREGAIVFVGLI
jgi:beta-lactamase regulating signal transducer with metallopeptidase domain